MTLSGTVLVVVWIVVAIRFPTLWRDQRQRALWASVFGLALVKTAAFPPVAAALGVPVAPHLIGVVAAFFLLRFVGLATGARGRRWPVAVTGAVLMLLGVLALASDGIDPAEYRPAGDLTPAATGYWLVVESYLGTVLASATVLFWTTARDARAGLPRLALRTMAAGIGLIALHAVFRAVLIVAYGLGVPVAFETIEPVAERILAASVLLAVLGALVASTGRARAAAAAYRSLLALRPLWTAMRDAFPEIILFPPRRAVIELAGVDDVHLRLYRRVIEIRDGMLALREFLPADDPAAAEAAGDDPAEVEAAGIALALRRRSAGGPPAAHPGSWAPVGPEMADEVAWLRRVSAAYRGRAVSPPAVPTPRPSGSAR